MKKKICLIAITLLFIACKEPRPLDVKSSPDVDPYISSVVEKIDSRWAEDAKRSNGGERISLTIDGKNLVYSVPILHEKYTEKDLNNLRNTLEQWSKMPEMVFNMWNGFGESRQELVTDEFLAKLKERNMKILAVGKTKGGKELVSVEIPVKKNDPLPF